MNAPANRIGRDAHERSGRGTRERREITRRRRRPRRAGDTIRVGDGAGPASRNLPGITSPTSRSIPGIPDRMSRNLPEILERSRAGRRTGLVGHLGIGRLIEQSHLAGRWIDGRHRRSHLVEVRRLHTGQHTQRIGDPSDAAHAADKVRKHRDQRAVAIQIESGQSTEIGVLLQDRLQRRKHRSQPTMQLGHQQGEIDLLSDSGMAGALNTRWSRLRSRLGKSDHETTHLTLRTSVDARQIGQCTDHRPVRSEGIGVMRNKGRNESKRTIGLLPMPDDSSRQLGDKQRRSQTPQATHTLSR